MTTPHNYLGRISPLQISALNPFWPLPSQMLMNTPYNLALPLFTRQLPISYALDHHQLYKAPNSAYCNPSMGQVQAHQRNQSLSQPPGSVNRAFQKRFQKNRKANEPATINLISDDEEPCQLQKASQEKNTSSNCKTNEQNTILNSPPNSLQKQEPKKEIKNQQGDRNQPKPKEQSYKIPKTKEIVKPSIQAITKKIKAKTQLVSEVQKKRQIFSKRIIEKQGQKKQNYRVSKRQRQLLQVSFLRDSKAQILTGPQFQARLPRLLAANEQSKIWLNKLKNHLLQREYKEQQE